MPSGVVTLISPLAPSAATNAVICVAETTLKLAARTPPNSTSVAPVKFVPVITTICPTPAVAGAKLDMRGAGRNIKPGAVAVPPGVATDTISPAFAGTTAVICVADTTVNVVAGREPKLTPIAPVKFVPVIVTTVPGSPVVGVKPVMVGILTKLKPVNVPVPPADETATFPDAPAPTTAVI